MTTSYMLDAYMSALFNKRVIAVMVAVALSTTFDVCIASDRFDFLMHTSHRNVKIHAKLH